MTQQTVAITNYKCIECEAEVALNSSQAGYATLTALTAKVLGMPWNPKQFVICENCEASLETPYDF